MVTMPTEASTDLELVEALLDKGMNLMRINCAHDDRDVWERMVENLRRARQRTGRSCLVYADLGGPKLRTSLGQEGPIHVAVGEKILLERGPELGEPKPALRSIGCTLAEAVDAIEPGHRVFFDDGKIGCIAQERLPGAVQLEVVSAAHDPAKIKADAGVNLPDSSIEVNCLTRKDRDDLAFVVEHADLLGLSFVQRSEDVEQVLHELASRDAGHLGVVLKIETRKAFEALPRLLLTALAAERCGVMVARGDLAIEVGFERLAEVQEEILWLCEAAHVPVIWATQVLEHLAKKGLPSRAEVTDAAMSARAECVMLNKGPYIVEAVTFLDDVLRRMQEHQHKRRGLLRRLAVAG
jgi:pyruvate kinase